MSVQALFISGEAVIRLFIFSLLFYTTAQRFLVPHVMRSLLFFPSYESKSFKIKVNDDANIAFRFITDSTDYKLKSSVFGGSQQSKCVLKIQETSINLSFRLQI